MSCIRKTSVCDFQWRRSTCVAWSSGAQEKRNKLTLKACGALQIKLKIGKTTNSMVRNVATISRKPGFAGNFFTTWGKSCNLASSLSRTINYFRLSSWMWMLSENEHFRFSSRRIILRHEFRLYVPIYRIIIAIHWHPMAWCMNFTTL